MEQQQGPNIPLAMLGAAVGAAAGGLVWFLVEHLMGHQLGFGALLCGAAAGWGALLLGNGTGLKIGCIAAVFGAIGILGGSYGNFLAQKAEARDIVGQQANELIAGGEDEQQIRAREAEHLANIDNAGYVEYMKQDTKNATWMAIFGIIGMVAGFSIGSGGFSNDDDGGYDA